MKKIIISSLFSFLVLSLNVVFAQEDDTMQDDPKFRKINGSLKLVNKVLVLVPTDCRYVKYGTIELKPADDKDKESSKNIKEWTKTCSKLKDGEELTYTLVKGPVVEAEGKLSIAPKKIKGKLTPPDAVGFSENDALVGATGQLIIDVQNIVTESKSITIASEETMDAKTGLMVTAVKGYKSNCTEMNADELSKMKATASGNIGKAILALGKILANQAIIEVIKQKAVKEAEGLSPFDKIKATKNIALCTAVQATVLAEIPKIIYNLKKSKAEIDNLKN